MSEYTVFDDCDGKSVSLIPLDGTNVAVARRFDFAVAVDMVMDHYVIYFHVGGKPDGKLGIATYPTSLWRLHTHD